MSKLNQRLTGIAAACLVVVGGIAFAQTTDSPGTQPLPPTSTATTPSTDTSSTPSSTSPSTDTTSSPSMNSPSSSDSSLAPRSDRG